MAMKSLVLLLGVLVWSGCGDDAGLGSGGLGGDCEAKVLPGDHIVRSSEDAIRLERDGGCNYAIAGDLEITQTRLRVFEGLA